MSGLLHEQFSEWMRSAVEGGEIGVQPDEGEQGRQAEAAEFTRYLESRLGLQGEQGDNDRSGDR